MSFSPEKLSEYDCKSVVAYRITQKSIKVMCLTRGREQYRPDTPLVANHLAMQVDIIHKFEIAFHKGVVTKP